MECAEVDLELRLSVAGSTSSDNLLNAIESATSGTPLSLSYQRACLASKMAIDKNLDDTPKDERPPLIAMGCAICLVYVMVSKAHPKCPICTNSDLINNFQTKPTKKKRTTWY
ncbi:hypothetical protein LR48_Vigan02g250400 [Vigna angularis]|uniref:GIR1-like zinc ribbon domain-containing protein n=2 Tax=Phaseolus angularis TaxID=3914 RepID=A0A0L9U1R1_PHAAN|nr:hypothetical protein LR48_Vigan02g250400 [Vigna angularis]